MTSTKSLTGPVVILTSPYTGSLVVMAYLAAYAGYSAMQHAPYVPYIPDGSGETIAWALPYELQVICFKSRRVISVCNLHSEAEVNKAVEWLQAGPNQHDYVIVCRKGGGWTEYRFCLDQAGKCNFQEFMDRCQPKTFTGQGNRLINRPSLTCRLPGWKR